MTEPSAESLATARGVLPCWGRTSDGKDCIGNVYERRAGLYACPACCYLPHVAALLDSQIAKARAEERERCAIEVEVFGKEAFGFLAEAIRAL